MIDISRNSLILHWLRTKFRRKKGAFVTLKADENKLSSEAGSGQLGGMGKDDAPKDGQAAQIIKAVTPAWKSTPNMIKATIVVAVTTGWILAHYLKKESHTSEQTATQSGTGNALNQAGGNITINNVNNGAGVDEIRAMLREELKKPDLVSRLANEFPQGYALLGVANGHIIYEPKFKTVSFSADWDKTGFYEDPNSHILYLNFAGFKVQRPGYVGIGLDKISVVFPRASENVVMAGLFGAYYYEVIDSKKMIFVIGFK